METDIPQPNEKLSTTRPPKTASEAAKDWYDRLNHPLSFLGFIFAAAIGYFAWIDSHVRAITKNPDFISQIAQRVRPALVFNTDGAIADAGAIEMLESVPEIRIAPPGEKSYDVKVIVRPKKFSYEPILESLDISNVSVTAKRAGGISWEITVVSRGDFIGMERDTVIQTKPRYRLELTQR